MSTRPIVFAHVVLVLCVLAGCRTRSAQDVSPAASPTSPIDVQLCQTSPFDIPSLQDADAIKPGGLATSGELLLHVPADAKLPLTTAWTNDGRLVLKVEGQPDRTIGVQVGWTYVESDRVLVNALATLTDEELRGLWGVRLEHWSDAIAAKLQQVDPERVCITVTHETAVPPGRQIPVLPDGLRYLQVVVNSSADVFTDLSGLLPLRALRYFAYNGFCKEPFDVSLLKDARQLEHLDLRGQQLEKLETLGQLTELHRLDLGWCRELQDVGFASQCKTLEALRVCMTRVADLTPLEGLDRLAYLDADMSAVSQLPAAPLPALRVLHVMSTALTEESLAQFQQQNAACLVLHHWDAVLRGALAGATRLRVRSGGTCHREIDKEQTLFETTDQAAIQELVAAIAIDEANSGFHCMCCGDPSLEFYAGEKLVLTVGHHHAKSLRWVEGWPGDGMLTATSASFLVDWLAAHQVKGPQEAVEAEQNQQAEQERKMARAVEGLSPALQSALRQASQSSDGDGGFAQTLRTEYPAAVDQIGVLFALLGTSNDSWTSSTWLEQLAEGLLAQHIQEPLAQATSTALQGTDRRRRRGAARYWHSWNSPLETWQPENAAQLHRIVLAVQQEARYYPTRQSALNNLARWQDELGADEFAQRLETGLHDPHASVRRMAMIVAGRSGYQPAAPYLLQVLTGEPIESVPLPDVPPAETEDVPDGFDDVCGNRPEDEVAALALGYLKYAESKSAIEAKAASSPMFEVALALLGATDRLKPEHFRLPEENTELQLAAVEAVMRCRGRAGLQWAIAYQQSGYWWEEEVVAKRISKLLCTEQAPGSETLKDCASLEVLATWYATYRAVPGTI